MFVSYEFAAFLSLGVLLYYTIFKKYQWQFLLFLSLVFYSSFGWKFLFCIGFVTAGVYFAGLGIDGTSENKKACLYLGLLSSLGILVFVKYSDFLLVDVIGSLLNKNFHSFNLLMPVGISFYTFKSVSYLADVYEGKYRAERNPFKFALYVTFFPEIIQGPISRFDDISETLFIKHAYTHKAFLKGLYRIMWGYMKKMLVADRLLPLVLEIVKKPEIYNGAFVFTGAVLYAIELYADFTGGIDITVGIAEILGIKLRENFIRPYFSKSVKEYWTRWHITMGSWFRDYVFYPVSVSNAMTFISVKSNKIFGKVIGRRISVYLSTIIVWFLTGLWHGAGFNFIAWGLLNGIIILISNELRGFYSLFHRKIPIKRNLPRLYNGIVVLRTIFIMNVLRMLDCYGNVKVAIKAFMSIFTVNNWNLLSDLPKISKVKSADFILIFFSVIMMIMISLLGRRADIRDRILAKNEEVWYFGLSFMLVIIVVFGNYGIGYEVSEFIYNRY